VNRSAGVDPCESIYDGRTLAPEFGALSACGVWPNEVLWSNEEVDEISMSPSPDQPLPADVHSATALLSAYADAIDAGDFDLLADILADAVLESADGGVVATGRDEVLRLYSATTRRHEDGTPRTAHLVSNVVVSGGAHNDQLLVSSRFCVMQATDKVPLQAVAVGRYADTLERSDGVWRFARRRMIPEFWGDISDHLMFDPR